MNDADFPFDSDLTGYQYDEEASGILGTAGSQLERLRDEES